MAQTKTKGTAAETGTNAEEAVRQFLVLLDDPKALIDQAAVEAAEKAVDEAEDPIDRLKAIAARVKAATVDEQALRAGFVAHAKKWADQSGVPLSAFQEMRVPADVLSEAGYDVKRGRTRSGGQRQRAKAVPLDGIKEWVLARKGEFRLVEIMENFGGSPATVRKAVEDLMRDGKVESLGPVPNWTGRGRAPIHYRLVAA